MCAVSLDTGAVVSARHDSGHGVPMTDAMMREAERRWRASRTLIDEAAYLAERLRAGLLRSDNLALAAFFGHEAARVALRENAPQGVGAVEPWNHWLPEWCERLRRLPAWDTALYARAALAAFEASPEFIEQRREWRRQHPADRRPEEAIASLEAFALCPCAEHDRGRRAGGRLANEARRDPEAWGNGADFFNGYLLAVWEATGQESLCDLLQTLADPTPEDHRRIVGVVSRELIVWVLGTADPILNGRTPGRAVERSQFQYKRERRPAKGASLRDLDRDRGREI
jgi:hypothetical protein